MAGTDYPKMSLSNFRERVKSLFYPDFNGELRVEEITDPAVWEKMATQIFRSEEKKVVFYAVHNQKITVLGGDFGYSFKTVVCDLDADGKYECIYTYESGSGVSVGILGIYSPFEKIEIGRSCIIPSTHAMAYFVFEKKSEKQVELYVNSMDEKIMHGTFELEVSGGTKRLEIRKNLQRL